MMPVMTASDIAAATVAETVAATIASYMHRVSRFLYAVGGH